MKRLWWSFAAPGLLAALACGRPEASSPSKATLFRHLAGDPASLDPTTTTEEAGLLVEEMIFRPLVGFGADRQPVPSLATSWTVSPDGLVYEFHLDPRATWEGGAPVTSDDVRFTIERVRDPKIKGQTWSWGFEDLAAIETPDATTVRVRFRSPYAERLLAFSLPVVSAAAYRAPAEVDRKPVGSGPYRLESWESNQRLKLVRRDGVPDGEAAFPEIVFRVIPDPAVRFQAGARGELDEFRIGRDQRKTAEASPDFLARNRILAVPQFLEVMVVWNLKGPLLADVRVRRALALAWPREEASRRLYPPNGASLVSGPYPPGAAENAPDVAPPKFDPLESARLLDEAGWRAGGDGVRRRGGKKAVLELLYRAGAAMDGNLAEILRASYEKVGVELVLRPLEWAAYAQRADAGEFDAMLYARIFLPPNLDPYPYYDSGQWAPKGQNLGFYGNAEADRAMQAARREVDPSRRLELYRQVHRILAAEPPADFLWGVDQTWGIAKRVEGVTVSPLGLFHFLPGPLGWRPAPAAAR